jgi:uncharacterized protein (DUF305 family)
MIGEMPPIEHHQTAEIMERVQSMEDAIAQARKIANEENPDQDSGKREVGKNMSVTWEKDEAAGKLIAHITLEKDGKTEAKDVTFIDMTGGKAQEPVYEAEGVGPTYASK